MHPYTKVLISAIPEIKKTRREKGEEVSISGEIRSLAEIPSRVQFPSEVPYCDRDMLQRDSHAREEGNRGAKCCLS